MSSPRIMRQRINNTERTQEKEMKEAEDLASWTPN